MVTAENATQYRNGVLSMSENFFGMSTDEKPTGDAVGNGSCFVELDTHKFFFYDAENAQWLQWETN